MKHSFRSQYDGLEDKQIIELILALPHNEEAAAFLLYCRYNWLLLKTYHTLHEDQYWFEDCVDELFMHLRGNDNSWKTLSSFEWRSTFGCWLKRVARHKFIEVLPRLIDKSAQVTSIDGDSLDKPTIQISNESKEDYERRWQKVLLLEAIEQLKDDQRFVILKRLEGYNSTEIALLLQKKWQKNGTTKYSIDRVTREKVIVVPDADYVNVLTQRAKKNLQIIMD